MKLKPVKPQKTVRVGMVIAPTRKDTRLSQSDYVQYLSQKLGIHKTRIKNILDSYHAVAMQDIQEYHQVYVYKDILVTNKNANPDNSGVLSRTFAAQCGEAATNAGVLGTEVNRVVSAYVDTITKQASSETGACVFKTFNLKKQGGQYSISKTPHIDLPGKGNGVVFSAKTLNSRARHTATPSKR